MEEEHALLVRLGHEPRAGVAKSHSPVVAGRHKVKISHLWWSNWNSSFPQRSLSFTHPWLVAYYPFLSPEICFQT